MDAAEERLYSHQDVEALLTELARLRGVVMTTHSMLERDETEAAQALLSETLATMRPVYVPK